MAKVNDGDLKLDSSDKIVFTDVYGVDHTIYWDSLLDAYIINDTITGDFKDTVNTVVDTRAPSNLDDSYDLVTIWLDSETENLYVCTDNTPLSASWHHSPSPENVQDIIGGVIGTTDNINVVYDDFDGTIDYSVETTTSSTLGVASFDTSNFAISGGHVTVKTNGITALELTSSLNAEPKGFNVSSVNSRSVNDVGVSTDDIWTAGKIIEYVNNIAVNLSWTEPVISKSYSSNGEITEVIGGDRFIVKSVGYNSWIGHDNEIAEYTDTGWLFYPAIDGLTLWVADEDTNYTFNSTSWVKFGTTITHNNALGLQGGNGSTEFYHFTDVEHSELVGSKPQSTVFMAPSGNAGIGSFRLLIQSDIPYLDTGHIIDFVEDVQDVAGTMIGDTSNISVVYDDLGGVTDYSIETATTSTLGLAKFNTDNFTVTAGDVSINDISIDHGSLSGLTDDDHAHYVHLTNNRTIIAQHTFNPSAVSSPFIIGANALKQMVVGLNTDYIRGIAWNSSITASPPATPLINDIWIETL